MNILQYILLICCALVGGSLAYFIRKGSRDEQSKIKVHNLFLSFSGSYLFGIVVLHLIPEVYQTNGSKIGLFVLVGFFIQILLEQLSHGIEHGHIHIHEGGEHSQGYIYGILLGLSVHAFMEGIPLGGDFNDKHTHNSLLVSVALHKIPESFAMMNILLHFKIKKYMPAILLLVFSLLSPFAAILSNNIRENNTPFFINYFPLITAVVIGSFLHITTTILFESGNRSHHFPFLKILAILLGIGLSLLTF